MDQSSRICIKILKIQKFKNVDFSNGKYFLKNTLFRSYFQNLSGFVTEITRKNCDELQIFLRSSTPTPKLQRVCNPLETIQFYSLSHIPQKYHVRSSLSILQPILQRVVVGWSFLRVGASNDEFITWLDL